MTTSSRKPEKATITNIDTKDKFEVLFNPTDYSLSKTNNWTKVPIRESDVPRADFSGGDPTELKVQLFVDTRERGEDARTYVNKIVKLTEIAQQSDGYRPPRCMFSWGPVFSFVSVITSLTYKYTLFREDGTPVRATMDISFRECEKTGGKKGQESPPAGIPGYKVHIVKPGDTIDGIATKEYGDPKVWRFIADTNNLNNPKSLQPGQALVIEELQT